MLIFIISISVVAIYMWLRISGNRFALVPLVIGVIAVLMIISKDLLIFKKREELNNLNRQDIRSVTLFNIPNQVNKSLDSLEINESDSIDSIFSYIKQSDLGFLWKPSDFCCEMILTINLKNNKTVDFKILSGSDEGTMLLLIEDSHHQERLLKYKNINVSEYMRKLCEKINTLPSPVHCYRGLWHTERKQVIELRKN